MNPDATKRFGEKLLGIYTGAVLTKLIEIGYQVGLFEGTRAGPATSAELADRLGLKERYVREWLGAMTRHECPRPRIPGIEVCRL